MDMAMISLQHEGLVRTICFVTVLVAMLIAEYLAPRRAWQNSKPVRWTSNLAIVVVDSLVLRLFFPLLAVQLASVAEQRQWGLLNHLPLPGWLDVIVAIMFLDLIVYLQHVMVHAVPVLWRLHRMHHSDLDFDTTTGVRFHPIEIALSMGLKLAAVAALGFAPLGVLLFEILLNATSLFNHANLRIPQRIDRVTRWFVVTPDMHRVHHSAAPVETNSNFGFNLPWWDRLFGTYRAQPTEGHERITIGVEQFRDPADLWFHRLLIQPFQGAIGRYPISQRNTRADKEGEIHQV